MSGAVKAAMGDTVLAPHASCAAPAESETLLLMLPGANLGPADFTKLAESVQAQAPDVRLWVGLPAMDLLGIATAAQQEGGSEAAQAVLDRMVKQATEQGFKARSMGWGRCTNLYLMAHSAAGLFFSDVAFRSANGFILLASTFDGQMYPMQRFVNLEDWGRPVMLLGGELDGQMRWPWFADYAYDAACLAAKTSPMYAAANKPFVLVPGANHGQTSNGVPNLVRGDIPATADYGQSIAALGLAVASFMTAQEGADAAERKAAASVLLRLVQQTAQLTAPYLGAKGLGDTLSVWQSPALTSTATAAAAAVAAAIAGEASDPAGLHTSGAAPLQGARRQANARFSQAVHPGVIAEAERYAVEAQLRLAATLPRAALEQLQVVACVHMDVEMLLRNQPMMEVQGGRDGKLLLVVHVLVWYQSTDDAGNLKGTSAAQPAAPQYWMKLKRPQAIAEELGLEGTFADGMTAQDLQSSTIQAALGFAPEAAARRYREAGKQLVAADDAIYSDSSAEKFLRDSRISFEPQEGSRTVHVAAPRLTSSSIAELKAAGKQNQVPDNPYTQRFLGNWYAKVMSTGMALEWVVLDSLRGDVRW